MTQAEDIRVGVNIHLVPTLVDIIVLMRTYAGEAETTYGGEDFGGRLQLVPNSG